MNLFSTKIRYDKTMENGMVKKTTEEYMVDALSFTEAEERIIKEMTPSISGEFTVAAIKRENISELFDDGDGDRYYKCKVMFITIDEKSAKEKKTASYMLIRANDLKSASEKLALNMKGSMADYDNAEIKETKIIDIFPYSAN